MEDWQTELHSASAPDLPGELHTHTYTYKLTYTLTHAHSHTRTHTLTHTLTHTPQFNLTSHLQMKSLSSVQPGAGQ